MTDDEYADHIEELVVRLARLSVDAGRWSAEGAEEKARAAIEAGLPQGRHTEGRLFFTAEDDEGPVGILYLGTEAVGGYPGRAWVHDIRVVPERRGQGHGRALLAAAEREMAARGRTGLALNVMPSNTTALRLYESSGYVTATQVMVKDFT